MEGLRVVSGNYPYRYSNRTMSEAGWLKPVLPGYVGSGYVSALPDTDLQFTTANSGNPQLDYTVNFATTGTYYVWIRGYAPNAAGDSLYLSLDDSVTGIMTTIESVTGFAPREWSWANTTLQGVPMSVEITTPGLYTLQVWMREDGLHLDRLLLITDNQYFPTGAGPAESNQIDD